MVEHYFTPEPGVASREQEFSVTIRGIAFRFVTDRGVFSRGHLDRATEMLIKSLALSPDARVLDLGCGYGPLGIAAAKLALLGRVVMVDVNARALDLARRNVVLNAVSNATVLAGDGIAPVAGMTFTDVVMNPPFRTGKTTVHRLIAEAYSVLVSGGCLWVVVGNKQGAPSLKHHLTQSYSAVVDAARGGGVHVFRAVKT